jgi:hypothetical protein
MWRWGSGAGNDTCAEEAVAGPVAWREQGCLEGRSGCVGHASLRMQAGYFGPA